MDKYRPGSLIDLHSCNKYTCPTGYTPDVTIETSSALTYMHMFSFLDSLWFGEAFSYYSSSFDYWLVEMSGIPFGLMAEQLCFTTGCNDWRGMIFGEASRPDSIMWSVWNSYNLDKINSEVDMHGHWDPRPALVTSDDEVYITTYFCSDLYEVLISIASWSNSPTTKKLYINWDLLGFGPSNVTLTAPFILNFQPSFLLDPYSPHLSFSESQLGYLLVLSLLV